jgi:hypothetical protein
MFDEVTFAMADARHTTQPPRHVPTPPPRIAAARRRASVVRRSIGWGAVASFGALLVLVKSSHPARQSASSPTLTTPATLLAQAQDSSLGGGSISATSAQPSVSTTSS